ncbi:hypothetical protein, partial [Salmonella enterica]|uniref:hypothetical protein n=1 Tax=Salmonella enterica TaxID=28901 RepID=UPI003525994A
IIAFTPLKNILPGYLRPTDRKEYLAANDRIDSLLQVVAYNDMYINNVNAIMTGDLPTDSIFSTYSAETVIPENPDSLLAPSEAEAAFVEEYRLRNEFNLPEPTDPDVQNSHPQFAA